MKRVNSRNLSQFQHALVSVWLTCAGLLSVSCLVTERIEFGEGNVPANVTRTSPELFSRAMPQSGNNCEEVTLNAPPKMLFEVNIYDANVDDELVARLVINGERDIGQPILPTKDRSPNRGLVRFCIEYSKLQKRCNYVQIAVSRKFAENSTDPLKPADDDDIARVEYFVLGDSNTAADASERDCALWLEPDGGLL